MPRRAERDYEIVIPVRIKDDVASGARSVENSTARMGRRVTEASERDERERRSAFQRAADTATRHENRLGEIAARGAQQRLNSEQRHQQALERVRLAGATRTATAEARAAERSARDRVRTEERFSRDVQRIHLETRRQAEQNDRALERSARQLADARTREMRRQADAMLRLLGDVRTQGQRAGNDTGSMFGTVLAGSFFGNLAANAVRSWVSELARMPGESRKIAVDTQNAFKGLESVAKFKGFDPAEVERMSRDLKGVRLNVLGIGDATASVKNLLSAGFGLEQAKQIIDRFTDSAAFNRQTHYSLSEAVRVSTEGIRNQNSILSDAAGMQKNLSVILKERGFELEDLTKRTTAAAAREALYQGVLAETAAQHGDAEKAAATYSGAVSGTDVAYQNLQRTIGDFIITNPVTLKSLQLQADEYRRLRGELLRTDKSQQSFFTNMIKGWELAKVNTINSVEAMANAFEVVVRSMALVVGSIVTVSLLGLEGMVNGGLRNINKLLEAGDNPFVRAVTGTGALPTGVRIPELDVGGQAGARAMQDHIAGIAAAYGRLNAAMARAANNRRALFGADTARNDFEGSEMVTGTRSGYRPPTTKKTTDTATEGAGEKAGRTKRAPVIRDEEERFSLSEFGGINAAFKAITGRNIPVTGRGQTATHNRMGLDHSQAIDVGIAPGHPDFPALMAVLNRLDVPHRVLTASDKRAGVKMTNPHTHIGAPSRGFGAKTRSLRQTRGGEADDVVPVKNADGSIDFYPKWAVENFQAAAVASRGNAPVPTAGGGVMGPEGLFDTDRTVGPVDRYRREQLAPYQRDPRTDAGGGALTELATRQQGFDAELEAEGWRVFVEWQHKALDVTKEIATVETNLFHFRQTAADDQMTEQRRLLQVRGEELELLQQLQGLDDQEANLGANAALRQQVALREELLSLRRADYTAIEDQVRATARLNDATVVHGEQVRASVMTHMASQQTATQAFGDAITGTYDRVNGLIGAGISKLTGGIRELDGLLMSVVRQLTNRLFQRFLDVLVPTGGGGASSNVAQPGAAAAGPTGIGSAIQSVFGGGAANPAQPAGGGGIGGWLRSVFGGGGAGGGGAAAGASPVTTSAPASISGGATQGEFEDWLFKQAGGSSAGSPGGAPAGFDLKAMLGAGLPAAAVAISLGTWQAALNGNIGPGKAALGGGLVGVVLSYIGRSRLRKQEEARRNQATLDTRTALFRILAQVQTDQMSGPEARDQVRQLHSQWLEFGSGIKDAKTRRHHLATWDHFKPIIDGIEKAAGGQDVRANARTRMAPVFAGGGFSDSSQLIRVRPGEGIRYPGTADVQPVGGRDRGFDSEYRYVPKGTQVYTQSEMRRSPGFQLGGFVDPDGSGGGRRGNLEVSIELYEDDDGRLRGMVRSPDFEDAVVHVIRKSRRKGKGV